MRILQLFFLLLTVHALPALSEVSPKSIKIKPADVVSGDYFGIQLALDGDVAILNSWKDDRTVGTGEGSLYEFTFNGINWVETEKIEPIESANDDSWGRYIEFKGDHLFSSTVIGLNDDLVKTGSVTVFRNISETWTETDVLFANDGEDRDFFGTGISHEVNRLLIGAYGHDLNVGDEGAVYYFEFENDSWIQKQKLTPQITTEFLWFGRDLVLAGDFAFIGAMGDDELGNRAGAVFIFESINGTWIETGKLLSTNPAENNLFGIHVDYDQGTLIVSELGDDDVINNSGAVYIYELIDGVWRQIDKLKAPDPIEDHYFGTSIAISGNTLIIGADLDDDLAQSSGAAYYYQKSNNEWRLIEKITHRDSGPSESFGGAVATSENRALIGMYAEEGTGAGYIFDLDIIYSNNFEIN